MLQPIYQSTATPTYCSQPTGAKMAPLPHLLASFYPHSALLCPTPAPPSLVCIGMATAGHTDTALKAHYLGILSSPATLFYSLGKGKPFGVELQQGSWWLGGVPGDHRASYWAACLHQRTPPRHCLRNPCILCFV